MPSPPINVAVLGYGFSALTFQLPFITSVSAFKVHTILQRSGDSCLRDFPGVKRATTLDEILEDDEVDLVVVSTRNDTHADYTRRSLEAGKHVVVEKPFTNKASEALELCELAKRKGLVLSVYHNRRWDSDFLTVAKLVREGTIGKPVFVDSHFDRYDPHPSNGWREKDAPGSGVLYDLGSHLIDQIMALFGRPATITAHLFTERAGADVRVDDAFYVWLGYPKEGVQVLCTATCLSAFKLQKRWLIRGAQGSYVKYGNDPQEASLMSTPPQSPASHQDTFGVADPSSYGTITMASSSGELVEKSYPTERGQWVEFYRNVAAAIQKNDPTLVAVKPESAAETIEILDLARKSAAEGVTIDVPSKA